MITAEKTKTTSPKKKSSEKILLENSTPEKVVLQFNQRAFDHQLSQMQSIELAMTELAQLMSNASIMDIDVDSLLAHPHRTAASFVDDEIKKFVKHLRDEKMYNWPALPEFHALILWAEKNAGNNFISPYWRAYDLHTGSIKPEAIATLRETCTLYCSSAKQAEILRLIQVAVDSLNSAQAIASPWLDAYGDRSEMTRPLLREGRNYAVNTEFISKL